jgi:trehalose/maltose hydrolase-like predicted phosphorylase
MTRNEKQVRRKLQDDPRLQEALKRKGLLPEHWLDDATSPVDPWRLETSTWNPLQHRDAFLGNGWLGQRFTPDGDGTYEGSSQSWCYGVREADGRPGGRIRELPAWASLVVREPVLRLRRHCQEVTAYRQVLDLERSCLETCCSRTTPGARWDEERLAWIARHEPGLAVLECRLTPRWGEHLVIDETVDAGHCADARELLVSGDEAGTLVLSGAFGDHRIAIAVRVLCDAPISFEVRRGDAGWRRRCLPELVRDRPLKLTKVVGIATSDQHADPVAAAINIVERACTDLESERSAHEAAWAALWERRIEIDHPRLQALVNAACHTLYCSVRGGSSMSIPPCGLSSANWRGQVFWDADTWMLPVLDLLQPELGESLVEYRLARANHARALAAVAGETGARIPWQSADDGSEGCTIDEFIAERHVGSSVALGLWQHWLITGNRAWLSRAWPLLRDLAAWWAARAKQDGDGSWHLRRVGCPDEYAGIRDDNACTNAGAATTLRLATSAALELGETADPHWMVVAQGLVTPAIPAQMCRSSMTAMPARRSNRPTPPSSSTLGNTSKIRPQCVPCETSTGHGTRGT